MSSTNTRKTEVVIVGGGPAGAASALYLLQSGIKPIILEKEEFPRYHIGESMTGECGGLMRKLGFESELLKQGHPKKRGVKVYGTGGKNSFWVPVLERDENNELQPNFTWQVLRSKFDKMILDAALERGAELLPFRANAPYIGDDNQIAGVQARTPTGSEETIKADVVIDASGQATFLSSHGIASARNSGGYDKQVAVFSQVGGAIRDPDENADNTLIFYQKTHHWAWFIPLDDDRVSVGVVVPSDYYASQKMSNEEFLLHELRTLNPELSERLPDLTLTEDVRTASNYSYRIDQYTGKGFLCVGDSHRFIDPIFSFGLYVGMKEASLATESVKRFLAGDTTHEANPFSDYQITADTGQNLLQDLIDLFWEYPLAFQYMVHHSNREEMIDYFAGRIYGSHVDQNEGIMSARSLLNRGRKKVTTR